MGTMYSGNLPRNVHCFQTFDEQPQRNYLLQKDQHLIYLKAIHCSTLQRNSPFPRRHRLQLLPHYRWRCKTWTQGFSIGACIRTCSPVVQYTNGCCSVEEWRSGYVCRVTTKRCECEFSKYWCNAHQHESGDVQQAVDSTDTNMRNTKPHIDTTARQRMSGQSYYCAESNVW